MDSFFIGKKQSPKYLVEIYKKAKRITVSEPDKYSKREEFYDKYALGKMLIDTKYSEIIFTKSIDPYRKYYKYSPEIIVRVKDKYYLISEKITELHLL
jgi:hypothetical protein